MNLFEAKKIMRNAGYSLLKEADDYSVHIEPNNDMANILDEFIELTETKDYDDSLHTLCTADLVGDEISIHVFQKGSSNGDSNEIRLAFEKGKFILYDPSDDHIVEYYDPNDDFVEQIFTDIDNFF